MNNKNNKLLLIILILGVFLITSAFNLPNPSYEFYVYDQANIIDEFTENYIIEVNKELSQKTGAQVVVATINSLEGMDINRYATALFEDWKIGSRQYDNGLLILIVPDDGELWIETGYGLEGTLSAGLIKRIINENMLPSFAQGDLNDGVILGFEQILNYIEKEYEIKLNTRSLLDGNYIPNPIDNPSSNDRLPNIYIIIGIIIFLFIDFKFFGGWLTLSLLRGGRGGRGGGGYGGGYGGSGGSSGGGGRSGGGGAGGSW